MRFKVLKSFFILLLTFNFSLLTFNALNAQSPFQVDSPSAPVFLKPGEAKSVSIQIKIPPHYFVYQEKTQLKFLDLKGFEIEKIEYPASKERNDLYFKKKLNVFEGETPITVFFKAPAESKAGGREIEGLLSFQGCSDVLCYPEETHLIPFSFNLAGGAAAPVIPSGQKSSWSELLSVQDFRQLMAQSWWVVFLVVFLGGFLTSLTPCVLPVIPITLIIIGVRSDRHWSHNFILSAVLVLGLALMYALLGVLAVALGKSLGFAFQAKWFVLLLAVFFFILSLSMFGLFDIHLPQSLAQRLNQIKGHGLWGAFISGMAAGILAAPCAGPVIGALLLYVATTESYLQGFGLLVLYALGMGLLFIILGTGYGTLEAHKRWRSALWAKRFLGILLLVGSLFYFNTVFPVQKKIEGLFRAPSPVVWVASEAEGLKRAAAEGKVMLVDFYAEWCAPCKELDIGFFRKKEVVDLLNQMVPVRIDATFNDNPDIAFLLKKYQVVGWPTILFVSPEGKVLNDLTVISYQPKLLLENMKKALADKKSNNSK